MIGGAIDSPLARRLDAWLLGRARSTLVVMALLLVAGLGYLDFATGPELTPILFYLVPIAVAAWYGGRGPGAIIAAASGLAWVLSDALTHGGYADPSVPYWNAALRLAALLLVSEAVSRLRVATARARELARIDPLTGVANLRSFYERAAAEIARSGRYHHPFTVICLDLDAFQEVNERLGHIAGDAVLRAVARALVGVLRASDTVARMGGDEFVILLPETGSAPSRLAVGKLREALSDVVPAHGWRITASIGVVTYLVPPGSVDALIGAADRLRDSAKRNGKNAVAHETQNEAAVLR